LLNIALKAKAQAQEKDNEEVKVSNEWSIKQIVAWDKLVKKALEIGVIEQKIAQLRKLNNEDAVNGLNAEIKAIKDREKAIKDYESFVTLTEAEQINRIKRQALEILENDQLTFDERIRIYQEYDKKIANIQKASHERELVRASKILDHVAAYTNQIAQVIGTAFETRIKNAEIEKDKQIKIFEFTEQSRIKSLSKQNLSAEEYAKEREKIESETALSIEGVEKKSAEEIAKIKRKQWKAEKASAITKIAIDTALGILRAWVNPGYPGAIPLSALIGAFGIANTAIIASQKMPSFQRGGVAPGGMALVGEAGPELAYLPRGTQVINNTETKEIIREISGKSNVVNNWYGIRDISMARNQLMKKEGLGAFS